MRCILASMVASLFLSQIGFSEESQLDELAALKDLALTDIATSTRPLDPDLAPGLVLILTSKDLRHSGAQTVGDALSLIPGITYQGLFTSPIVRGVGGAASTASGKIKFQLNGQQFNEAASATDAGLLDLRITAVEKIEVIRGPGSSVHGEYALSAVINVVTKQGSSAVVGAGSGDSKYAEFVYHTFLGDSGEVSIVAGVDRQRGQEVTAGPDRAALIGALLQQPNTGNTPGSVYDPRENKHLVARVANETYSLDVQHVDHSKGTLFGIFDMLADNTDDTVLNEITNLIAVSADYDLGGYLELKFDVSFSEFQREFEQYQAYPVGFLGLFTDGAFASSNEELTHSKVGSELTWYGAENAITFVGASYTDIDAKQADLTSNIDLINTIPGLGLPGPSAVYIDYPIGFEGRSRYISSIYAQQEYKHKRLNITAGAHYDEYSDVGSNLSPRLAAVWDFDNHNIFKLGWSEAFRVPSFVELYNITSLLTGAADIQPETVTTKEMAYIHRREGFRVEISLYDSEYNDVIASTTSQGQSGSSFTNAGSFDSHGVEVAFEFSINDRLKAEGYVTYQDAKEASTGNHYPSASDWLNSIALNYQLTDKLNVNGRYFTVGQRYREAGDPRSALDGYDVLNINLIGEKFFKQFGFKLSIVNALDEDVVQPALVNTYPNDYPRAGRAIFGEISTHF